MSTAQIRAVYRHLLRTVAHGVRHDKPVVKNLRRLLREDVRNALHSTTFDEQATQTFLLHLAAQRSSTLSHKIMQQQKQKSNEKFEVKHRKTPLHRVLLNVASLSYHHLSPNTVVQPNERSRRIGGSDSTKLRKERQQKVKVRRSRKRVVTGGDETTMITPASNNVQVIPSLSVAGSRPRGPVRGPSRTRLSTEQPRWNGQKYNGVTKATSTHLQEMALHVDELAKRMYAARDVSQATGATKEDEKRYKHVREQFLFQRGVYKGALRSRQDAERMEDIGLTGVRMLTEVVQRAQGSANGAWIGAQRFGRWSRGEWLEPA